nr:MAG TPA: hypothetical protein [Caudoviricetes sp.]
MYTSKMIDQVGDTTDGYIALAHAVVKLACQDYIAALKDLDKNPNNEKAFWRKGECEISLKMKWKDIRKRIRIIS